MIEILLRDNIGDVRAKFVFLAGLISWLTKATQAVEDEENIKTLMEGYIILRDEPQHIGVIIICRDQNNKKMLDILMQPPGEFKDKYIPCVSSEEPTPVQEKKENDDKKEEENEDKKEDKKS